jgi:hypothetical protein
VARNIVPNDGQTAFDRPDVTTAVFKSRLDLMKKNIRNGKYFGGREITYTFHLIEYQFRGLPHAHIVLRLADAPDIEGKNGEELISFINKYFIAEMLWFEGDEHKKIIMRKIHQHTLMHTNINHSS